MELPARSEPDPPAQHISLSIVQRLVGVEQEGVSGPVLWEEYAKKVSFIESSRGEGIWNFGESHSAYQRRLAALPGKVPCIAF